LPIILRYFEYVSRKTKYSMLWQCLWALEYPRSSKHITVVRSHFTPATTFATPIPVGAESQRMTLCSHFKHEADCRYSLTRPRLVLISRSVTKKSSLSPVQLPNAGTSSSILSTDQNLELTAKDSMFPANIISSSFRRTVQWPDETCFVQLEKQCIACEAEIYPRNIMFWWKSKLVNLQTLSPRLLTDIKKSWYWTGKLCIVSCRVLCPRRCHYSGL